MLTPKKLDHCETCARAEINPRTGLFNAGCLDCTARHIAHLQVFAECQRLRDFTEPYMSHMHKVFGAEWESWHKIVKSWAKQISAVAPVDCAQAAINNVAIKVSK